MGGPGPDDGDDDSEPHVPPTRTEDGSSDEPGRRPGDAEGTSGEDREKAPIDNRDPDGPEANGGPADRDERRDSGDRSPPPRVDGQSRPRPDDERVTIDDDGVLRWFLRSEEGTVVVARDFLTSIAIVAVIGLLLFGLSGVWPPLVAIESGSMEPNMHRGDLVFVADEDRFVGDDPVEGTGIVPLADANDHSQFGEPGDVIIFRPGDDPQRTPVIHRAHFWVEEGDNWIESQANPEYVGDATCDDVRTCPAPHDGFVTKGDANQGYDQVGYGTDSNVVRPEWVTGKAVVRIPYLGYVRLTFDALLVTGGAGGANEVAGTGMASVGTAGTAGAAAAVIGRRRI